MFFMCLESPIFPLSSDLLHGGDLDLLDPVPARPLHVQVEQDRVRLAVHAGVQPGDRETGIH